MRSAFVSSVSKSRASAPATAEAANSLEIPAGGLSGDAARALATKRSVTGERSSDYRGVTGAGPILDFVPGPQSPRAIRDLG